MTTRPSRAGRPAPATLTQRQREVLHLVARGKTNFQIAQDLGLSLEGVKYHLREIMGRLDVGSREEAAEQWKKKTGGHWGLAAILSAARPIALLGAAVSVALVAGLVVAMLLNRDEATPAIYRARGDPSPQATGCTTPGIVPNAGGGPYWVRFLRLNSISYGAADPPPDPAYVDGLALGTQVGTVRWDVAAPGVDPCHAELDGSAAGLPAGTRVYAIAGYRPTFRVVAVQATGERALFELRANPKAKSGADMIDMAGKVKSVEIREIPWREPNVPGPPIATISDPATLRDLEALIEGAPVDVVWVDVMPAMSLTFILEDGSAVRRPYQHGEGLGYDTKVPERFSQIIDGFVKYDAITGGLVAR